MIYLISIGICLVLFGLYRSLFDLYDLYGYVCDFI